MAPAITPNQKQSYQKNENRRPHVKVGWLCQVRQVIQVRLNLLRNYIHKNEIKESR